MDDFRGRLSSLEPNRSREARPAAIEPFGLDLTQQSKQEGPTNFYHVAPIKFREAGQTYEADTLDRRYLRGERVLVETQKGLALAFISQNSERRFSTQPMIKILRRIEDTDLRQVERNAAKEEESFRFCMERIKERQLSMKLIRTEVLHGGNKAIFYFSAEGRIDFRELVKDLAHKFHLRIEMRQVGVRDEAKLMGGVGACGRELCCSTWLKDFAPVSLKMARDQNLALNPQKVSGVCGRLMCCLSYEEDSYRELRRGLPRLGRRVITPKGEGEVRELDVLRQRVRVSFDEFQEIFPVSEIKYASENSSDEDESVEDSPERSREERKERGRRMLERRGIIGSGEASAAAANMSQKPDLDTKAEAISPALEPERREDRRPREESRGPRDERRGPRDDNRNRGPEERNPRDESRGNDQRAQERGPRDDSRRARDERGDRGAPPVRDERGPDQRGPRDDTRSNESRGQERGPRDERRPRDDNRGNARDDRSRTERPRDDSRGPRDDNRNRGPEERNPRDDNRGNENRGPRDERAGDRGPRDDNRGNSRDDNRGNRNERPRDDNRGPQNDARGPRDDRDNRGNEQRGNRDDRRRPPRDDSRGNDSRGNDNRGNQDRGPRDDNRGNQRDDRRPQTPAKPLNEPPKGDSE